MVVEIRFTGEGNREEKALSEIRGRGYRRKDYFMQLYKKRIMLIVVCLCFSSFAAEKQKTEITIDKIIATHEQIKQYDEELNRYYERAGDLYVQENGEKLRQDQEAWLKERNASLSELKVLEKKYKERLSILKGMIEEKILRSEYAKSRDIAEPKEKIYPPYPDVWGYDLSEYPAFKWGGGDIQAYRMDDGDIWFIISVAYKENPKKNVPLEEKYLDEKYVLIKFFKQEFIGLTREERWKLSKTFLGKKSIYHDDRFIKFKMGETLEVYSTLGPKLCFVPDFFSHYLIKTTPKGEEKFTILASSPQVDVSQDNARCDVEGAPFLYQKLYFLPGYLVGLEDDTFLVFTGGSNLILRFDKDFNTRFHPQNPVDIQGGYINRNFFVLDYSVIEALEEKYSSEPIPVFQTIHDALLIYLHDKFDGSNKENDNGG